MRVFFVWLCVVSSLNPCFSQSVSSKYTQRLAAIGARHASIRTEKDIKAQHRSDRRTFLRDKREAFDHIEDDIDQFQKIHRGGAVKKPAKVCETISDGDWNIPVVWSCGVAPVHEWRVIIKHTVTVPFDFFKSRKDLFLEGLEIRRDGYLRTESAPITPNPLRRSTGRRLAEQNVADTTCATPADTPSRRLQRLGGGITGVFGPAGADVQALFDPAREEFEQFVERAEIIKLDINHDLINEGAIFLAGGVQVVVRKNLLNDGLFFIGEPLEGSLQTFSLTVFEDVVSPNTEDYLEVHSLRIIGGERERLQAIFRWDPLNSARFGRPEESRMLFGDGIRTRYDMFGTVFYFAKLLLPESVNVLFHLVKL
eukprot:Filipodium_phascolosomae@DN1241_c0_g1_i2.p1